MWTLMIVERGGFHQTYRLRRKEAESLYSQLTVIAGPNVDRIQVRDTHGNIQSEYINYEPCTCGKCHHCIPEDEYNT